MFQLVERGRSLVDIGHRRFSRSSRVSLGRSLRLVRFLKTPTVTLLARRPQQTTYVVDPSALP